VNGRDDRGKQQRSQQVKPVKAVKGFFPEQGVIQPGEKHKTDPRFQLVEYKGCHPVSVLGFFILFFFHQLQYFFHFGCPFFSCLIKKEASCRNEPPK
jgi:hypothetical protein